MLWVKAFHIIAMVTWFSALFYLPRLFVYHAMSEDSVSRERFKVMERKLYRGIMTPSAVVTVTLGLWLVSYNPAYYMQAGWFHLKLACVLVLLIYHGLCQRHLKRFKDDANPHGHVYFRWFNEFPVILLLAIVVFVVVKPF